MSSLRNSLGQGAMEYLTTYGWAILVVVVVGMVLWQAGVFDSKSSVSFSDWMFLQPMSSGIVYSSYTNQFQAVFNNVAGVDIEITDVLVNETMEGAPCTNVAVNGVAMPAALGVDSGVVFKVTADCPAKSEESAYSVRVQVEYDIVLEGRTSHTEIGRISGAVE